MRRVAGILALCVGLSVVIAGAATATSRQGAAAAGSDYRFAGNRALLIFHVHADRTNDFEDVMRRIRGGLAASASPVRREQAAAWQVFRSIDSAAGAVYVVMLDRIVPDSDYDPVKMLTEFVPGDLQAAYERLRSSVARIERLDLATLP